MSKPEAERQDETESDLMTVEAWCDLDAYGMKQSVKGGNR